jgi:hypothetical protein
MDLKKIIGYLILIFVLIVPFVVVVYFGGIKVLLLSLAFGLVVFLLLGLGYFAVHLIDGGRK